MLKNKKGITLIALVITIIVLLILAGVALSALMGDSGILTNAEKAKENTSKGNAREQLGLAVQQALIEGEGEIKDLTDLNDELNQILGTTVENYVTEEEGAFKVAFNGNNFTVGTNGKISEESENPGESGGGNEEEKVYLGMDNEETDSGIGCYVYFPGENDEEGRYGVIYADLAFSSTDFRWGVDSLSEAHSYTAEDHDELKKYYLNGTYHPGDEFGTAWEEKPLLVVDETQGGTIDRFFVMDLSDFIVNGAPYCFWDQNKNPKTFGTSKEFGSGWDNTYNKLVNTELVEWSELDIWNNLNGIVGWFVPSMAEWVVFANELGVRDDYSDYGLYKYYWTSSQNSEGYAWRADFVEDLMAVDNTNLAGRVRLSRTF